MSISSPPSPSKDLLKPQTGPTRKADPPPRPGHGSPLPFRPNGVRVRATGPAPGAPPPSALPPPVTATATPPATPTVTTRLVRAVGGVPKPQNGNAFPVRAPIQTTPAIHPGQAGTGEKGTPARAAIPSARSVEANLKPAVASATPAPIAAGATPTPPNPLWVRAKAAPAATPAASSLGQHAVIPSRASSQPPSTATTSVPTIPRATPAIPASFPPISVRPTTTATTPPSPRTSGPSAPTGRKFRFSQKSVDALPPQAPDSPSRETEYSDSEVRGLRLLVGKGGRKTYYLRYTWKGVKRCDRIGEHGPLTLADARRIAEETRRTVALGNDPRAVKEDPGGMTFQRFALDEYMPHARASKRSADSDESKLRVHLFPRLGSKPLSEITTADIQRYHDSIRVSHCPATANRHFALVHRMFKLAVQWGRLEKNPASGIRRHQENNKRQRFLSAEEIGRFWDATAAENDTYPEAMGLFRFLLLTGLRLGEALKATWENMDQNRRTLFLPETKAGSSRFVVLNDEALEVLRSMEPFRKPGNPYIFPGEKKGKAVAHPWKPYRRVCERAGLGRDFRIHDLRHTFASVAINGGATLYDVKNLLGHHCAATTERYAHLGDARLRMVSGGVSQFVQTAVASAPAPGSAPGCSDQDKMKERIKEAQTP